MRAQGCQTLLLGRSTVRRAFLSLEPGQWNRSSQAAPRITFIKNQPGFATGTSFPKASSSRKRSRECTGVDFWDEAKGHGIITCTKKGPIEIKGNQAKLATHNEWRTADGTKILDEDRVISFTPLADGAYLIVFDIDMAATGAPLTFGDTKEGSFGIRINDALREQGGKGKLTNAEGKTGEKQVWGMRSRWCDYSGELNGKKVGLTIFDDPSNPPSCWHSRGYGLMAANPFGRGHAGFPAVKGQTDLLKLPKDGHTDAPLWHLRSPGRCQGRQGGRSVRAVCEEFWWQVSGAGSRRQRKASKPRSVVRGLLT